MTSRELANERREDIQRVFRISREVFDILEAQDSVLNAWREPLLEVDPPFRETKGDDKGGDAEDARGLDRRRFFVAKTPVFSVIEILPAKTRQRYFLTDADAFDVSDIPPMSQYLTCSLPSRPRLFYLAAAFSQWMRNRWSHPGACVQLCESEDTARSWERLKRIFNSDSSQSLSKEIDGCSGKIVRVSQNARHTLRELLRTVLSEPECVRRLFRLRTTKGSISHCLCVPPSLVELLRAFNRPHTPAGASILTVGARALSKHAHRGKERWFGKTCASGSERAKNESAVNVARKIIRECVWMNLHFLPHDTTVFELRVNEGYGMRWSVDVVSERSQPSVLHFRGFLEPQMENGHERGWRH